MAGKGRTPSATVSDGLTRNGLGPERVIEIQRARILAAMVEVVAEHGLADATVARVVARAGVSRRTFYEIFKDREDCFLAALDEGITRASRYVLEGYDPEAEWNVRLRSALTRLLRFLELEHYVGQLLVVGSLGAGPEALERRQRVLAEMIAFVDQGRNEPKAGGPLQGVGTAGDLQAELPLLMAQGIVGGVLSIIHARLLEPGARLVELANPLMGMIVLPYLGPAAARAELARRVSKSSARVECAPRDPLRELDMRLTYRTVRVLASVAANSGSSNREIGEMAGMTDQGQISKLLGRLERLGLVHNIGLAPGKGAPNAWRLTDKGREIEGAMSVNRQDHDVVPRGRSRR